MSDRYDCEETREHYHQVRRGEVTESELARYRSHLEECEACQAYVMRLDGMLDAAGEIDMADEVSVDRDALFSRIMADIDHDAEMAEETALAEVPSPDEDVYEIPRSPRRWAAVALLAAAVVVGAIGVVLWSEIAPDAPLPPDDTIARGVDTPGADARQPFPDADPLATKPSPPEVVLADLEPREESPRGVRLFAAKETEVEVEVLADIARLEVERGTLLVEYDATKAAAPELAVEAGELKVRVVGTIFYVHHEEKTVVGVVTGKVEVTTDDGEKIFLTDGQEYDREFGIRTADSARRQATEEYVDVEAHRTEIARADRPARPAPTVAKEVAKRPPISAESRAEMSVLAVTLRDQATEAVRLREYSDAARLYEELIVELPSNHPAAMSARLDVARLYMKQLGSPGRAVPHLKRFIVDRPNDPATPSVRKTLCRLLEAEEKTDVACSEMQ